jgi:CspA family cold shock protein
VVQALTFTPGREAEAKWTGETSFTSRWPLQLLPHSSSGLQLGIISEPEGEISWTATKGPPSQRHPKLLKPILEKAAGEKSAKNWDGGAMMAIGTVKFFNPSKGFGFITPEGGAKDVFVHFTAVEAAGMTTLSEGQRISFDIQPDPKGTKAVNLKRA